MSAHSSFRAASARRRSTGCSSSSRCSRSGAGSARAPSPADSESSWPSRALVTGPRLLLLDEPSAGLSPIAIDLVFDKLVEIRSLGIAIVMVEQNARRALALADTGYVLDTGRNAYTGPGPQLLNDPRVIDLYLGGTKASSSTSTSTSSGMNPATK